MLALTAGEAAPMTQANQISARTRLSVNLKRLRQQRGLSQEQLAERAGFHRTYVSQLERCVTNISIDGLERLAGALAVDVCDVIAPV